MEEGHIFSVVLGLEPELYIQNFKILGPEILRLPCRFQLRMRNLKFCSVNFIVEQIYSNLGFKSKTLSSGLLRVPPIQISTKIKE
jgi:hypothetical protein